MAPVLRPEMRSGTSNCHVRLSTREIDSPLVTNPNILMAMNEPSLHKFLPTVQPGGRYSTTARRCPRTWDGPI
jgi:Pyruvate/2-oxoacid:ferredoxin oxidoreductase gamma subunit